jgi:hypothetical protein
MAGRGGALLWAAVAALGFAAPAACSGSAHSAAATRRVGVTVILGDAEVRPRDQHPGAEAALAGAITPQPHEHGGARSDRPVSAELRRQLDAARRRARSLMVEDRLGDAGYYVNSYYAAGVGSHYIDWPLVDLPFTPETPAMVLVDTTPGHIPRLAGFAYWVRSPAAPQGFAGDADVWHSHRGLCFQDEVLTQEEVPTPAACAGTWIDGGDLWMLHAWVVPGYENPDGVFTPVNPKLCPPRRGTDAVSC